MFIIGIISILMGTSMIILFVTKKALFKENKSLFFAAVLNVGLFQIFFGVCDIFLNKYPTISALFCIGAIICLLISIVIINYIIIRKIISKRNIKR
jgi:uncharacterized membrane protein YczE